MVKQKTEVKVEMVLQGWKGGHVRLMFCTNRWEDGERFRM